MMFWKPIRVSLLALSFGGVLLVVGKSVLAPTSSQRQVTKAFEFPTNVDLPGWQSLGSQPLSKPLGRSYQYHQKDLKLEIEMRYAESSLENETLFREYNPLVLSPGKPAPIVRQRKAMGAYTLSVEEKRAYLRSCINPYGDSAITYTQFIQNRYAAGLPLSRLLPWVMGKEGLLDNRCLWAHLSLPIQDSSPEKAYQVLEDTWVFWYKAWHFRLPKH